MTGGGHRIAALLLAAGGSSRLGHPKQLLIFRGRPLVRELAEAACRSVCAPVAVVLGAHQEMIRPLLEGLPLSLVSNSAWPEGMASSIRAGISWAAAGNCDAALILSCDQPLLTVAHLDRLARAYPAPMIGSRYGGVLGIPAVFDRSLFPELTALQGDQGARHLLRSGGPVIEIDWPEGTSDVDTPEDASRFAC